MAGQQQLIDNFTVMHKGGKVLYAKEVCPLKGNPINDLVRTVLLEVCDCPPRLAMCSLRAQRSASPFSTVPPHPFHGWRR